MILISPCTSYELCLFCWHKLHKMLDWDYPISSIWAVEGPSASLQVVEAADKYARVDVNTAPDHNGLKTLTTRSDKPPSSASIFTVAGDNARTCHVTSLSHL